MLQKMNSCNAQMHVKQERHGTETACARQQTYCLSTNLMFWRKKRSKTATDASRSDHEQQETDAASSQTEAGAQTSEPAVFEFGRRTADGLVMQGVCKTDLKSDIPACIWRVDDAAAFQQAPQNAPKYHIEF